MAYNSWDPSNPQGFQDLVASWNGDTAKALEWGTNNNYSANDLADMYSVSGNSLSGSDAATMLGVDPNTSDQPLGTLGNIASGGFNPNDYYTDPATGKQILKSTQGANAVVPAGTVQADGADGADGTLGNIASKAFDPNDYYTDPVTGRQVLKSTLGANAVIPAGTVHAAGSDGTLEALAPGSVAVNPDPAMYEYNSTDWAYIDAKVARLNARNFEGKTWTREEVAAGFKAENLTPEMHYAKYGKSEGLSYGGGDVGTVSEQVNRMYKELFNRDADAAGLEYWVNAVQDPNNSIDLDTVRQALINGAKGDDVVDGGGTVVGDGSTVVDDDGAMSNTPFGQLITNIQGMIDGGGFDFSSMLDSYNQDINDFSDNVDKTTSDAIGANNLNYRDSIKPEIQNVLNGLASRNMINSSVSGDTMSKTLSTLADDNAKLNAAVLAQGQANKLEIPGMRADAITAATQIAAAQMIPYTTLLNALEIDMYKYTNALQE